MLKIQCVGAISFHLPIIYLSSEQWVQILCHNNLNFTVEGVLWPRAGFEPMTSCGRWQKALRSWLRRRAGAA